MRKYQGTITQNSWEEQRMMTNIYPAKNERESYLHVMTISTLFENHQICLNNIKKLSFLTPSCWSFQKEQKLLGLGYS